MLFKKKKQEPENIEQDIQEQQEKEIPKGKLKVPLDKRKIYFGVILLLVILIFIFISRLHDRWYVPASVDVSEETVSLTPREDMTGKQNVILGSGTFFAGKDIPVGRYMATVELGYGSFVVYEPGTKLPEISEVLGKIAETAHVENIAVTLVEGQEIEIKRLSKVIFKPLLTELRTELTTGIWDVGLDIEPGKYTVSSKNGLYGSITVLNGDVPAEEVFVGEHGMRPMESDALTLKEGQTIRISDIPTVIFNKN